MRVLGAVYQFLGKLVAVEEHLQRWVCFEKGFGYIPIQSMFFCYFCQGGFKLVAVYVCLYVRLCVSRIKQILQVAFS